MPEIDASRVIDGSFGTIMLDGELMTNFNKCQVKDEFEMKEIKIAGKRRIQHKVMGQKGSGNISGYKATSQMQQALLKNPNQTFQLISKLADPEAYGNERLKVSGIKFTSNQLADWEHGTEVAEAWDFVYDDEPEFLDPIEAL